MNNLSGRDAARARFHSAVTGPRASRLLALAFLAFVSREADGAELRIDGTELAQVIQTAFRGTAIRLHHGETPEPGSFVRLGPGLGGETIPFDVPAAEIRLGLGATARYRVDDVNSLSMPGAGQDGGPADNIVVDATPAAFVITIRFESDGTEIRGAPAGWMSRFRDGTVPDLQIDGLALQILLTPKPDGHAVAFEPARVFFQGDVQAQGTRLSLFGWQVDVLDQLTDYKTTVKAAIEREVRKILDRSLGDIATTIETEVRRRAAGSILQVSSMHFEGTTLSITGRLAE